MTANAGAGQQVPPETVIGRGPNRSAPAILGAAGATASEYSPHSLRRGMTGTMLRNEHPETVAKATRMATLQNVVHFDARTDLGRIVLRRLGL